MKIVNLSNNTIYVDDLDMYLPYRNGDPEEISSDTLKKSPALRGFILSDWIKIIEYDENERIESSLVYMKSRTKQKATQKPEPEELDLDKNASIKIDPPQLRNLNNTLDVKLHGLFYDAGGYAKVNRNLALMLSKAGVNVRIDPKRGLNSLNETELKPLMKLTRTPISKNYISIDGVVPSFAELSGGRYRILYTTIESYSVPDQFITCCEMYDEIWTTSEFSSSILRKRLDNRPVYTVTTGVDTELYSENGPKFDFKPNINDFVFISVFGWNYRKGYDVLLKAYFDEFSANDNVSLLIVSRYQSGRSKYHKDRIKTDIENIMKDFSNKDLPHVVRYSDILPESDMPKLYRSANCFVLPSRGECIGLPPMESSMCGLPVIMTNCSGQQAYLRPDNAFLIEYDQLIEVQHGQFGVHYWDGQQFPALTSPGVHAQLKRAMRSVVEDYTTAKERNRNLQRLILKNFTWTHTANAALDRLQEISAAMRAQ